MNNIASNQQKQLSEALTAIKKLRRRVEELEGASSEPIAVIGMGCRFPPDIDSPDAFWALLERGGDGVRIAFGALEERRRLRAADRRRLARRLPRVGQSSADQPGAKGSEKRSPSHDVRLLFHCHG